jgi:4-aminobutyrate aminotransferase/(S)-3-amino-2-methylpropionate transaminase
MGSNTDLHRRRGAAVARGVANSLSVYAQRAQNAELWDVEGRRYIDFASGISVLNTGHLHPRVVAALQRQLKEFTHTCFQVTPYEGYVALCERLNALAPGPTPKKSILFSTGAEAIENALKIARYHTRRSAVIAFGGAFHGRTLATMALTGKVAPYKAGFGPLLPDVYHVPFPCAYHGITPQQSLAAIEQLFKTDVEPSRVAAVLIEPVQGEGGFYIAPPEFLRSLRTLCDNHGILLVADEIQCGMARAGPDDRCQEHRRRRAVVGRHRQGNDHGRSAAGGPRGYLCRLAAGLRSGPRGARCDC